eukprot:1159109-Pelagomonas_calceolata.AAC.8
MLNQAVLPSNGPCGLPLPRCPALFSFFSHQDAVFKPWLTKDFSVPLIVPSMPAVQTWCTVLHA